MQSTTLRPYLIGPTLRYGPIRPFNTSRAKGTLFFIGKEADLNKDGLTLVLTYMPHVSMLIN